ncbi:MAG: hypothetical protein HC822_03220 [Oscillochloris sp.]|nr:hypothetical protein [Oscillochloris sp.]
MSTEHDAALHQLIAALDRAGLRTPVEIMIDALAPLDVVTSQFVALGRPFVGGTRFERYVAALSEVESWPELRRLLDR